MLSWFCERAGLPAGTAGGLFVSGGSMANLTALAAARDAVLGEGGWERGVAYVSEQTHSSVAKGLHVIGVPRDHVRVVPCDGAFRMDVAALERAVAADEAAGLRPFVAVATAGTTNTGSVDPLREVARVCRAHGLWMHVDGAFGASVLLTRHRGMLDGVELADSLLWDAHKWLFQTYSCGMVLVRDRAHLVSTYAAHPEYLRDLEGGGVTNPWDLGPELTRPARRGSGAGGGDDVDAGPRDVRRDDVADLDRRGRPHARERAHHVEHALAGHLALRPDGEAPQRGAAVHGHGRRHRAHRVRDLGARVGRAPRARVAANARDLPGPSQLHREAAAPRAADARQGPRVPLPRPSHHASRPIVTRPTPPRARSASRRSVTCSISPGTRMSRRRRATSRPSARATTEHRS